MAVSAAKKRANRKYQAAHYDALRLDIKQGDKARIQAAAKAAGVSVAVYVRRAIAAQMTRDGLPTDAIIDTLDSQQQPPND